VSKYLKLSSADYNSNTGDADWAPYRLGVVYEAPSVTDEATGPRP